MRYMLLMSATLAEWPSLDPAIDSQLRASGELVSDGGLAAPEEARLVCAASGGPATVAGPPFPPAREFLAGYWVVDCDSPGRAIELAARVSASRGADGAPLNLPVEVRQVMRAPGEEM